MGTEANSLYCCLLSVDLLKPFFHIAFEEDKTGKKIKISKLKNIFFSNLGFLISYAVVEEMASIFIKTCFGRIGGPA